MKRLNLRPSHSPRSYLAFAGWALCAITVFVVFALSASVMNEHGRLQGRQRSLRGEVDALEAQVAQLRPKLLLAVQVQQALQQLRASEAPRGLTARLEEAAPATVWLTAMTMAPAQVRMTGQSPRWQAIETFIQALHEAGLTVQLESVSRESGQAQTYRFSAIIALAPAPGLRP